MRIAMVARTVGQAAELMLVFRAVFKHCDDGHDRLDAHLMVGTAPTRPFTAQRQ